MNKKQLKDVVIIGGGPAGMSTALMLAKRGYAHITIIEKRPSADFYEPDKSFNYMIDGRGQKLTDLLDITEKLAQISVPSTDFLVTKINAKGERKTVKLPIIDPNRKTAYWLQRREFVNLLYQEIKQNWQKQITVLFSAKCLGIKEIIENKLEVTVQDKEDNIQTFIPSLLVGCDGLNSLVRKTLNDWSLPISDRFQMKQFPSPSSGLRYKVLTFPPQFPLSDDDKDQAICNQAYVIRGTFKGQDKSISLGLLPLKNPDTPRTANLITRPHHQLWELKNSEEFYQFFEQAFPHLPISKIITPEEAERCLQSEGGSFPIPQYCPGCYWLSQDKNTGILLLGDAVHCFPPDIGQGVNSALEDVYIFDKILSQTDDDLTQALPQYEEKRSPDIYPLIKLVQTTFPWQYNQDPLRRQLWNINFFVRLTLSRILPFIFSPPAFILIQNHHLNYAEIWRRSQRTTFRLWGVIFLLCLLFLGANNLSTSAKIFLYLSIQMRIAVI
ncbi:MAG: NAD(P)/FAD-dependent oxidoreductase [Crocosphaera sp.]